MNRTTLVFLSCAALLAATSGCTVGSDTCVPSPARRAAGEPCSSGECGSDAVCVDGVCAHTGSLREPCGSGCAGDLVCSDGLCRGTRSLAPGSRCEWLLPEPCVDGYWCSHPDFGTTGTCAPQVGRGEACTDDEACSGGLVCADGVCGDFPTAGQRCSSGFRCAAGSFCSEGTCWGPPAAEGDRCRGSDCPAGLFCDGPGAPVCTRAHAEGEPCASYRDEPQCAIGLYCNPNRHACERPYAPGEVCEYGDRCSDGTVCQLVDPASGARRCDAPVEQGGFCGDGQVCVAGTYCDARQELELDPDGCFYAPCP